MFTACRKLNLSHFHKIKGSFLTFFLALKINRIVIWYLFILLSVGVKLLPFPVVSGQFLGQVKPWSWGSENNCGFALGSSPPDPEAGRTVFVILPFSLISLCFY